MIVAELSMITMGTGTSASRYVRAVHRVLRESGLKFVPGPMSTSIEAGSMKEIFEVVEKADDVLAGMKTKKIVTTIKIDHRLDKEISIETKMEAIRR